LSNATERAPSAKLPEVSQPAAAAGLPNSRRAVLGAVLAGGAVAAGALPAIVAKAEGTDSELFALEAEIGRLDATAKEIQAKRIEPFDDAWLALVHTDFTAAGAFGRKSGRESAVEEVEALHCQGGRLFARMIALPAHTQAGRAAKVRTLLSYAAGDDWRGPSADLDWEIEAARQLLGEFAGMSEEELANV
jgi:hypothetical protein